MLRNFAIFLAVAAGCALGGAAAGAVGTTLLGGVAFAAGLAVSEKLESSRRLHGFWLRYRGALLQFGAVALGIALGTSLFGGFWGFVLGGGGGAWAGGYLGERWGWSGRPLEDEVALRTNYLAVLVSAANADGVITLRECDRIAAVGKDLFSYLGYDAVVATVVDQLVARPAGATDAARFMAALAPDLREMLRFDVLKILYCGGRPSEGNRRWLEACRGHPDLSSWAMLPYFDRGFAAGPATRAEWLAELGLAEGATAEQVRDAYRALARAYHPDKLAGVPPQVRALAEAKMATINRACENLTGAASGRDGSLVFRSPDADSSFRPEEDADFHCRCWLCNRTNRVPARAIRETCRCGGCHALVGLTFDPAAA